MLYDDIEMVKVNGCCPAILIHGVTINGNTYWAWDIQGREVFISDSPEKARDQMQRALKNGMVF